MANGHGGLRHPVNPAPVSGPGKLARRTDGGPGQKLMAPTGMDYGDHAALMNQERTAPMAQADSQPTADVPAPAPPGPGGPAGPPGPGGMAAPPTPIGAPGDPSNPITAGVDFGPGPGSEVLPMQHTPQYQQAGPMTQLLQQLSARDTSGVLSALYQSARAQGA